MSIIKDFKQFALRGNLIDMAVGFTVGAAFSTIAKSLVDDMVMPVMGLALGKADFSNFFLVLRDGQKIAPPYSTLAEAKAAGAVTVNYGMFINNVIAFLLVAFAMFILLRGITKFEEQLSKGLAVVKPGAGADADANANEPPANKKCPYCCSTIEYAATRCPQCTSQLEAPPPAAPVVTTVSG